MNAEEENRGEETSDFRTSPHNLEAEMSVLGAMLLEKEAIPRVIEQIEGGYFYKNAHRKIFEAIVKLSESDTPVDPVTLTEVLKSDGELDKVGGPAYLTTLFNYLPTAAHLDSYVKIVRDKALLRRLISTSTSVVNECYQQGADPAVVLDEVERRVFELAHRRTQSEVIPMRVLVKEALENVEHLQQFRGLITGLSTGFKDIDQITCGLQSSNLVVLAGRPSMGKTALALNIAEHAAVKEKQPVGIFSLEMSKEQLVLRLLCSHARVNAQNMRHGYLSQKDLVKLVNAAGRLSEAPIYIDDSPSLSNLTMRAKARIMKARWDIKPCPGSSRFRSCFFPSLTGKRKTVRTENPVCLT
jgi:replicative DNA helicase